MIKFTKKATAILLTMLLLFTTIIIGQPIFTIEAQAASYPTGYPNTYKNTGVGANDIIGVAKTQIGYQENYYGTKYGHWYSSYLVNQPWCAMFVSWCANQAGVSQSVMTKFASCSVKVNSLKAQGVFKPSKAYGGTYTPKKGDIIFYRNSGSSNVSDHVGLVAGLNGTYIHTIEGNSTNAKVCEFTANYSRRTTSSYVIGYFSPKYSTSATAAPTTYERWQTTADSLSHRASYSTSSTKYNSIPKDTILKVTSFKSSGGYLWGKTTYKSKAGWCALNYCEYLNGSIKGDYYQLPPTLSTKKYSLVIGGTKKISVTNGLGASYVSSAGDICQVSKAGKLTAVAPGTVTITITTKTGSCKATVTVKSPTINKTTASVAIGDKVALSCSNTKTQPTWSSANKKIATVTSAGKVTGVAEGTVKICGKIGTTKLYCTLTVTKYPTTYENFKVTSKYGALYTAADGKEMVKIPVGTKLKVKKVTYTTYTWGKTTYNGKAGWVVINRCQYLNGSINGTVYKKRIFLGETSKNIYLHNTYTVDVHSARGTVKYATSDSSVATVDSKGVVTGVSAGNANISVTNKGTTLTFNAKIKNPKLSKTAVTTLKSKATKLIVTGGSGTIKWTSSNPAVATVKSDGTVTALAYGTSVITAIRNNITMVCNVTVYDPVISATSKVVKVGAYKTLKVTQSSGKITWKSTNAKICKVGSTGKIKGVKAGIAYISATVDGKTLYCKVTVKK